jgi:hypothetical protein
MDDLRAAAERLTAEYDYQYWDGNNYRFNPEDDGKALAQAYLADHEETPIDVEFLGSIGFHEHKLGTYRILLGANQPYLIMGFGGEGWFALIMGEVVRDELKTRGQVRRLLSALGL